MRRPAGDFPGEKVVSKTCVQARQWALQRIFKPSIRRRFRRTDTSSESVVVTALSPLRHHVRARCTAAPPVTGVSPGRHHCVTAPQSSGFVAPVVTALSPRRHHCVIAHVPVDLAHVLSPLRHRGVTNTSPHTSAVGNQINSPSAP